MKLKQLTEALVKTHTALGLDAIDLMLLRIITDKLKLEGEATIMPIIEEFSLTSRATTHARLKKLIKSGFVSWDSDENNLRVKLLKRGDKYQDLESLLKAI